MTPRKKIYNSTHLSILYDSILAWLLEVNSKFFYSNWIKSTLHLVSHTYYNITYISMQVIYVLLLYEYCWMYVGQIILQATYAIIYSSVLYCTRNQQRLTTSLPLFMQRGAHVAEI